MRRVIALCALSCAALLGCQREPAAPAKPAASDVRTQWNEPNLGGVWQGSKLGASPGQDSFNLAQLERLYKPEARTTIAQISAKDDPGSRCVPAPFPRAAALGWPIQVVQRPGMILVLTEAFHTFRYIPTDGRSHESASAYQFPVFVGHSSGKWEGDTLVVDVIKFREPWLAGGEDKPTAASIGVWPTSDALHVTERWRRVDADTLEYQARVDDPSMLTGAWDTPKVVLKRQPIEKIEEVKCLVDDPAAPAASYLARR